MKHASSLAAALALLAVPSLAAAEISGAATVGLGRLTIDDAAGDANEYSLDFDFNYAGAGNLTFGANGGFRRLDFDGGDFDNTNLNLEVLYGLSNGFGVGAYYGYSSFDLGGPSEDLNAYGVLLSYGAGDFEGELALGQLEADGFKANEFSFFGRYNVSEQTQILGELGTVRDDGNGFNLFGVGVNHSVNEQFGLFGAIRRASSVNSSDFTSTELSIGVDYRLAALSSFGALVSLELARTNLETGFGGDEHINSVRLGLTMPLGDNGRKALPLNSSASSLDGNTRSTYQRFLSSGIGFF